MLMRTSRSHLFVVLALVAVASPTVAQERAERVREDLEKTLSKGLWIYNDLDAGLQLARNKNRPLLVVIRCIPCEACRGFDEDVAQFHPKIRELLKKFVCVRIPQANGLDLSLFQFDYDLSFYAFFLNADRTIYGRFGSPSTQKDKTGEVSIQAFAEALEAALDLHSRHDEVKGALAAKSPPAPEYASPEKHPLLKDKYTATIDYENRPVASCIHCHQIRDSERRRLRSLGESFSDRVLFPWPLPDVFGLRLDPRRRAAVERVDERSVAQRAGFRAGDEILTLQGQPLVSIADVQWVLHNAPESGELTAQVRRGNRKLELTLPLKPGWRRESDISWRVSTWDLRRMGTGGILLEDLDDAERRERGLTLDQLALRAKHVGQYGEHATAKRAGFRKGDIIVAVDGRRQRMSETDFIAHAIQHREAGDTLVLEVLRDGKKETRRFKLLR